MSLPLPELAGLEPCAECGHPRSHHDRAGCATDSAGHRSITAVSCPCTTYRQDTDTMPWTTDNDQTTTAIAEIITPLVGDMALATVNDQLRELGNQLAPNRAILTLPKLNDRAANCDPAIVWQDEHGHATVLEGKNGILPHVTGPLDVLGALRLAAAIAATAVRRVTADS